MPSNLSPLQEEFLSKLFALCKEYSDRLDVQCLSLGCTEEGKELQIQVRLRNFC